MSSQLSRVPVPARRRLGATLLLFAVLFLAIGAVAAVGSGGGASAAAPVFSAIALVVGVLLALMAWGVQRSIRLDAADASDRELTAVVESTLAEHGGYQSMCGCGVQHDPDELHVVDAEPCAHDGSGAACSHDCQTCVLAGLRARSS